MRIFPCGPEPKTPLDPCDRVKFILEVETREGEDSEMCRESHSIFTELEELRCDHHNRSDIPHTCVHVYYTYVVVNGVDMCVVVGCVYPVLELISLSLSLPLLSSPPSPPLSLLLIGWSGRRQLGGSSSRRTWKRVATNGVSRTWQASHYTACLNCVAASTRELCYSIWRLRTSDR